MIPEYTEDFTSQPHHIDLSASQILQEECVFPAGKVKVFEQTPQVEVKDLMPILYVPGWMGTLIRAEETMNSIASHGRKAVTLQFMRENGKVESDGKNRKIELQKAEMIQGVLDKKSLGRVDVIAHSEAGINTLIAACAAPENFRNIVLMNPAGLIGKDNPISFLWRFMKSGKDSREKIQDVLNQKNTGGGRYSLKEASKILERDEAVRRSTSADIRINKKMFASEIGALADSDIFEMLEYLKEHDVQVAIVAGYDDKLFPLKRMVQQIEKRYGSMGGAPVHDFYTIVGTHADIYSDAKFPGFLGIVTDQTNTEVNIDVAIEALRRMELARSSTK